MISGGNFWKVNNSVRACQFINLDNEVIHRCRGGIPTFKNKDIISMGCLDIKIIGLIIIENNIIKEARTWIIK